MARGRQRGVVAGLAAAILISLAAVSQCLAPSLTYEIKAGSYYRLGVLLNRYLKEKAGYELELVATAGVPENIGALLDPARDIHLAKTTRTQFLQFRRFGRFTACAGVRCSTEKRGDGYLTIAPRRSG